MDLMELLKATGQQDKIVETLGKQFGLEGSQTGDVVGQVLGALGGGVKQNAQQQGGLESLMGALQKGNHAQYVDQPENAVNAKDEGNKILGHILGGKEQSRIVAAQAEQATGVQGDVIKQMLPMIATMAMGAMSKKSGLQGANSLAGSQEGGLGGLMSMLDMDKDGSPVDDIMKLVGGFGKK